MEIQGIHLTGPHLEKGPTERHLSWGVYSGLIENFPRHVCKSLIAVMSCQNIWGEKYRNLLQGGEEYHVDAGSPIALTCVIGLLLLPLFADPTLYSFHLRVNAEPTPVCFLVSQRAHGELRHWTRCSGFIIHNVVPVPVCQCASVPVCPNWSPMWCRCRRPAWMGERRASWPSQKLPLVTGEITLAGFLSQKLTRGEDHQYIFFNCYQH